MTIRLLKHVLTSLLGAMALGLAARAQTTVQGPITYGSGQTVTVLGPQTVTTSGTVTVSNGANVAFLATSSVTLNAGFSCSGTFQASTDTVPPTVPTGFSLSNDTNVSFTINWAASTDNVVPVTSYQVSYNGSSLGTVTGTSMNISSLPPNNTPLTASTMYQFTVRAIDALGNTSAWSIPYAAVTTPFAAFLGAPLNNITVLAGTTVNLAAAAGGTTGSITKVEFYKGTTLIGTTTTNTGQTYPYQFSWTSVPWGTYTITAIAYDSLGEIAVTAPATIKVDAPPVVSLTAPANNAVVAAPASSITLTASATDSNDTITKVDFYQGTTLLGTATSAPYQFSWTNVPGGSYTLTAIATNSFGATTTSSPVTLIVDIPPVVSFTSPANSATFTVPAVITLTASASSPDGTVSKVTFYQGTTRLGATALAPYQIVWNNVPTGKYTLTAQATDNFGTTTTSSPITVTVANSPGTAPSAPSNLHSTGQTYRTITLAWTPPSGGTAAANYQVFRGDGSEAGATATTVFIDSGLTPGTSYTYTVTAYDVAGDSSPPSNSVTVSTLSGNPDAPYPGTSGLTNEQAAALGLVPGNGVSNDTTNQLQLKVLKPGN